MKKLSKAQLKRRQELIDKMTSERDAVEVEVDAYNTALEEAWERIESAIERLNEAVQEANEFRQEINGAQEEYYDERSENWQEGDAGQSYSSWKDEWENELEVLEIEKPDDLEMPKVEAIEYLETMPEELG